MGCKSRKTRTSVSDDVIFQILLTFRVKILCRFQCVSKSWRAIISDPAFRRAHCEAHRRRSQQNPLLLIKSDTSCKGSTNFLSLDKKGNLIHKFSLPSARLSYLRLLNTRLELICMYDKDDVCVCNPTTRELSFLPRRSSRVSSGYLRKARAVGFGYVPSTKEYKVIRVSKSSCDVFTVGVDRERWRTAADPPFAVGRYTAHPAEFVYLNGATYIIYGGLQLERIARFDLKHENWTVLIPPPPSVHLSPSALCQFRGSLYVIKYETTNRAIMWILKDCDKGVWVKKSRINLPVNSHAVRLPILALEGGGRILIRTPWWLTDRLSYFDASGRNLGVIFSPGDGFGHFSSSFYVESFFSLEYI